MKSFIILCSALTLTACGFGGSVKHSFPDVPPKLMDAPAEMKTIKPMPSETKLVDESPSGIALSAVTKIVTDNYKTCNVYKEQIFSLQSWISAQKKLNP